MINGSKVLDHPIRWAMAGGGRGSQIGYIHRSAALRDNSFQLVAGAFDIVPERGMAFAAELGVASDRCYPDYQTMFAQEAKRPDGIEAVSIAQRHSLRNLQGGFGIRPPCGLREAPLLYLPTGGGAGNPGKSKTARGGRDLRLLRPSDDSAGPTDDPSRRSG